MALQIKTSSRGIKGPGRFPPERHLLTEVLSPHEQLLTRIAMTQSPTTAGKQGFWDEIATDGEGVPREGIGARVGDNAEVEGGVGRCKGEGKWKKAETLGRS